MRRDCRCRCRCRMRRLKLELELMSKCVRRGARNEPVDAGSQPHCSVHKRDKPWRKDARSDVTMIEGNEVLKGVGLTSRR